MSTHLRRSILPSLLLLAGNTALADSGSLVPIRASVDGAAVDAAGARIVGRLKIAAGPARLEIRGGVVYPVAGADGYASEFVFLGRARFTLDPGDAVERQQVELFTGAPTIDELVTHAVLVPADEAVRRALLAGAPLPEPDAARREQASAIFAAWRSSPSWRRRGVFPALLAARAEGAGLAGYFAAWIHGDVLGDFLYVVDPDEREQAKAVQFVVAEITDVDRQAVFDEIRNDQKLGRWRDLVAEDLLGNWNVWTSVGPGVEPFAPVAYSLDVTIDRFPLEVTTVTTVRARAVADGRRVVRMEVSSDTEVLRARGSGGEPLPFAQYGADLVVDLGRAVPAGEELQFVVETRGRIVDDTGEGSYALRDTVGWHPRLPGLENAVFEATFTYPKNFDLLASGREVESGMRDGRAFQKRVLDVPALGFTFEIGNFLVQTRKAGHVDITVAFDPSTRLSTVLPREQVVQTIADALTYYEEVFGPYPFDHLTVVTCNRGFSQGMLSFLTIASGTLSLDDAFRKFYRAADARTILAHELAHQWWGNIVGWTSYRDQWISEAMATYASNLFAKRLEYGGKGQVRISMTATWRQDVQEVTDRGVPVEALGPISLGYRLASSLHPGANRAIVYMKGAVVLEMLSRYFANDREFLRAVRGVVDDVRGRRVSTEEFLRELEGKSALDLGPFADRFILGTGMPDVFYRYSVRSTVPGEWIVEGAAVKSVSPRWVFGVRKLEDGRFDIVRSATPSMDIASFPLVMPTQLGVFRDSEPAPKTSGKTLLDQANSLVDGRLILDRQETPFSIRLAEEPKGFWVDLHRQAYASCFNETFYPKKSAYFRAIGAAVSGDAASAEAGLRRAIEIPPDAPNDRPRRPEERDAEKQESRIIEVLAATALAHLAMDRGALGEASGWMKKADTSDAFLMRITGRELLLARARLEILHGDAAGAWVRLEKKIFAPVRLVRTALAADDQLGISWERTEGPLQDPQAYALAAIATRATGDAETYAKVLKLAKRFGVDVSALEAN